ncbi:MAG TPA: 3-deoxy-8-phosphooctulonate synthase [Bacteroidota bacterium]
MKIHIRTIPIGDGSPLILIAGPCVVESRDLVLSTAERIREIAGKFNVPVIFKSSYRKANRTSGSSFSGLGMDEALKILSEVRDQFGMPVLTDIHLPDEARTAAEVADVLQIPAFLCRQTDLLAAAGETGKPVNIKKGQFLSPLEMKHAAEKVTETGNRNVLLTERGTTFGYNNLVVDMRSLPIMRQLGFPVVLDVTHSVQVPGGEPKMTGGQPQFILPLARAGVAVGCDALFVETHPNPPKALSDSSSQLPLDTLAILLKQVVAIDGALRQR